MSVDALVRRPLFWVFLAACVIGASFALFTNHVWEDFYITFRSSKHLAQGDGLVHNLGERVHTFTSPIGVLLPAVASLLTLNSSDTAALWIFRAMAIGALGAAAMMLFASSRQLKFPFLASVFLVAWLLTDAKTIDFTINGMESPFMIAFFGYALWAMFTGGQRRWLHLGLAWAGMMWTRPDGFVTIAALSVGVWLFNDPDKTGLSRREWFPVLFRAAGVTTVAYLPWFLSAWLYYGTPVPHTIVAKSLLTDSKSLAGFWRAILEFPVAINNPTKCMDAIFNPAQSGLGGWPEPARIAARSLAAVAAFLWLVGPVRRETKAISFTFFCLCLYLNYFPPFPYAWYLTLPAAIGMVALAGGVAQLLDVARQLKEPWRMRLVQAAALVPAIAFLALGSWYTVQAARQLKAQQALIELGIRREIGEFLREKSAPGDTVFMEPLGYIGFYSGLKTYDYPGLSSPEVVDAIKRLGKDYAPLIRDLEPDWVVLRPREISGIFENDPELLQSQYLPVRSFEKREAVSELDVYGVDYIAYDSTFFVLKRQP